jgi:6-phosphogluconolactonase (cycloisomerase 2 family)
LTRVWSVDSSSGSLTECPAIEAGAGDGPRHGAFAEVDGTEYLYIINELGNSVSSYTVSYASDSGCLEASLFQTISTFPSNESAPANTKASEIHIRDGFVYASNRNDQTFGSQKDSIAQYAITASGELEFLDLANSHGYFPRTFSINEAGDYVAVGGQTDAVVAILARDVETGLLGDLVASVSVGRKGSYMGEDGLSAVTWAE